MSICPHCDIEHGSESATCRGCGQTLPAEDRRPVEAVDEAVALPAWLQQLKPPDTEVEAAAPPAATAVLLADEPAGMPVDADERHESDDVLLSHTAMSTDPDRAGADAADAAGTMGSPATALPTEGVEVARGQGPVQMTETASLINEDDLPAWLRAVSDARSLKPASVNEVEDESWMFGPTPGLGAEESPSGSSIGGWQAPVHPEAKVRSGAGSVFAKMAEGAPTSGTPRVARAVAPRAESLQVVKPPRPAEVRPVVPPADPAPIVPVPEAPAPAVAVAPAAVVTVEPRERSGRSKVVVVVVAAVVVLLVLIIMAFVTGMV